MANAIQINGTHKRRETYANEVLALAQIETNVYDDFSTDYEIDGATGAINVPTRSGEVTISDYDILNGVELTQSATDYVVLPVDKNYAINELIDGYEAEAVPDDLRANRIAAAAGSMGAKKENLAIAELVGKGTKSADTAALTVEDVYAKLAKEISNMKKRGMKVDTMRVIIDADTELLLLTDNKFANSSANIGAELLREGVIGKINGVAAKPNYNLPENVEAIIYDKRFAQKYEVWSVEPSINDLADGKHIGASALQGRMVGGLMLTNALGAQIKTKGEVSL
jgi:hypothetical protein